MKMKTPLRGMVEHLTRESRRAEKAKNKGKLKGETEASFKAYKESKYGIKLD